MPTLGRFDPPAMLDDFSTENERNEWSGLVSDFFDEGVTFNRRFVAAAAQFYHPIQTATDDPHQEAVIDWPAFPKLVKDRFPGNARKAFETAESGANARVRFQDEYLEWHVVRNAANKIVRVSFTCETTQYFEFLAKHRPQKLLALYKQLVDPAHANDVTIADLVSHGQYVPRNRWNIEFGAVHLIQPNNNLFAEVQIAAQACILRQRADGTPISDAGELIECARFGAGGRASDPLIGATVNAKARSGDSITLRNPVALYITRFSSTGIQRPNGAPAGNFWRLVRGTPAATPTGAAMGLHLVYEVPPAEGFVVGDMKIGGVPIEFGGQLAENIHVGLFAVLCRRGQSHNRGFTCGEQPAIHDRAAPPPYPLRGTKVDVS